MSEKDKQKKVFRRYVIKSFVILFLFLVTFIITLNTKAPTYFDSYVYYKDYKLHAHLYLILYRSIIYFTFPFFISVIEKMLKDREGKKFAELLLENFNVQFCAYSVIAGIYILLGIDKILNVSIFGSSEGFLFITAFIFSIILNKKFPKLFENS